MKINDNLLIIIIIIIIIMIIIIRGERAHLSVKTLFVALYFSEQKSSKIFGLVLNLKL